MRVKPGAGRNVRDPITKNHLPAEGAEVPETAYWLRRLKCGDVEKCAAVVEKCTVAVSPVDQIPDSVVPVDPIPDSSHESEA